MATTGQIQLTVVRVIMDPDQLISHIGLSDLTVRPVAVDPPARYCMSPENDRLSDPCRPVNARLRLPPGPGQFSLTPAARPRPPVLVFPACSPSDPC
jgi:hypothetical protein